MQVAQYPQENSKVRKSAMSFPQGHVQSNNAGGVDASDTLGHLPSAPWWVWKLHHPPASPTSFPQMLMVVTPMSLTITHTLATPTILPPVHVVSTQPPQWGEWQPSKWHLSYLRKRKLLQVAQVKSVTLCVCVCDIVVPGFEFRSSDLLGRHSTLVPFS
jgi:hypothetical protein